MDEPRTCWWCGQDLCEDEEDPDRTIHKLCSYHAKSEQRREEMRENGEN